MLCDAREKKINAQLSEYDEIMTACTDLSCAVGLSAKLIKLFVTLAISQRCNVFVFCGSPTIYLIDFTCLCSYRVRPVPTNYIHTWLLNRPMVKLCAQL